jgi:hypothetical protein
LNRQGAKIAKFLKEKNQKTEITFGVRSVFSVSWRFSWRSLRLGGSNCHFSGNRPGLGPRHRISPESCEKQLATPLRIL